MSHQRRVTVGYSTALISRRCSVGYWSVSDAEVREIARETAPPHVDVVDPGSPWAPVGPADELFDLFLVALGQDLNRAVRAVLDPAGQTEPTSFPLRRGPEIDPLHPAPNKQVHLLQRHHILPSQDAANGQLWERLRAVPL